MKSKVSQILKKELREMFRDKKSLAMMLIIPIFIPLLVLGMSALFESQMNRPVEEYNKIGLNYSPTNVEQNIMDETQINPIVASEEQLKEKFGIIITREETERLLRAKNFVGQTTIARLLTKRGEIPNTQYAFDNYFKYLDLKTPATAQLEQAIRIIHQAGGYAVLAHPISLEKTYGVNIEEIFGIFRDADIDGIEIFNSKHTLSDIKRYLKLAKRENLLISGGSDFHGEIMKPNVKLGKISKDNSEKEHHYKMTIISKCIDKSKLKDIYEGDELEL